MVASRFQSISWAVSRGVGIQRFSHKFAMRVILESCGKCAVLTYSLLPFPKHKLAVSRGVGYFSVFPTSLLCAYFRKLWQMRRFDLLPY